MTSVSIDQMRFISGNPFTTMQPQNIIVAKSILKPSIKSTLENFILTTNQTKDRERALRILTTIEEQNKRISYNNDLVKEYKLKTTLQRPKTAYTKLKGGPSFSSYTTAYFEDYPIKKIDETMAVRPGSTANIICRSNNAVDDNIEMQDNANASYIVEPEKSLKTYSIYNQHSTYVNDFCSSDKSSNSVVKVRPPNRAATASGSRCNNPHPSKAFLVWRFPRESFNKETRVPSSSALKANMENNFAQINDEQFNQVMRGNCRSTYQSDFHAGSHPSEQFSPFYLHPEIKTGEKLKISTQRVDYDRPSSLPMELSVPKDRYSCNRVKHEPAIGIIPQVTNKTYMHTFARTTYDEDINDRAQVIHNDIIKDIQRKVDLSKLHNMKDLERAMIESGNITDKNTLERVFQKLNEPEDYKRISFVRKPNYNTGKLSWISNYPGPL